MSEQRWIQTVPPDKATVESLYVVLIACVVTLLSALIIYFNQISRDNAAQLGDDEISVRYDLSPAEQGIVSDLLLVYEDWMFQDRSAPAPQVEALIADNWPPFTDVLEHKSRGSHQWKKLSFDGREVYLGLSQDMKLAGHFLWILPSSREKSSLADFELWLSHNKRPDTLRHLEPEVLAAKNWKKINRENEIKR